jgi:hypothetical protein
MNGERFQPCCAETASVKDARRSTISCDSEMVAR